MNADLSLPYTVFPVSFASPTYPSFIVQICLKMIVGLNVPSQKVCACQE